MDKQTDGTFSDFSHYQDSDAKIETISGSWDCFTVSWMLLIESLKEEIEQVTIHKWNNWKDTFLKFNGFFFALPVYEDCDTRDKTVYFSIENLCTNKRISIQTWMKDLNCVFLAKSEFQHLCSSILFALFGVSSMWKLQNDMIQQIRFWNSFVSFLSKMEMLLNKTDPKEIEIEFQLLAFLLEFSTDLWIFSFFWLLRQIIFSPFIPKSSEKN